MTYYIDALNGAKRGYVSYKNMPVVLAERVPFHGNSVSAEWEFNEGLDDCEYVVRSYGTVIAKAYDGQFWVESKKYSQTTSRIQNVCRRVWGV